MKKHTSKVEAVRERRLHARQRRLVLAGALSVAVLAGLATWYFLPRQGPLSAATPYQGGPRLAVNTTLIDLGPVSFEKVVQARFVLRNVGDRPLQIAGNPPVEVVEGC